MNTINRVVFNVIFCIQILLVFLVLVEERIELPPWLQVVGRLHPLVLHLPIGFLIFLAIVAIRLYKKQQATREITETPLVIFT